MLKRTHTCGDLTLDHEGEEGHEAGAHHGRHLAQRPSTSAGQVVGGRQVDDVEDAVDGPHHGDHAPGAGRVLQGNADEHEDQQAHADDVGHDAVPEQRPAHVGCRQVLRRPLALSSARYRL